MRPVASRMTRPTFFLPKPSGNGPEAVPVIGKCPVLAIQMDVQFVLADINACH